MGKGKKEEREIRQIKGKEKEVEREMKRKWKGRERKEIRTERKEEIEVTHF